MIFCFAEFYDFQQKATAFISVTVFTDKVFAAKLILKSCMKCGSTNLIFLPNLADSYDDKTR